MVVIVGDNNAGGGALNGGISFIGPTLDLSTASVSLAKSAEPLQDTNADGQIGAGDAISYSLAVTNTGSLPVSSLAIDDPTATGLSCPAGPLAPGSSATCTGTHVLTQTEVDSGSLSNTATASATVYGGTVTSTPSTSVVAIGPIPGIELTKTVAEPTFTEVGDVLHFEVTATNVGNVTLSDVAVTDPPPGEGDFELDCRALPSSLPPGSTGTCDVTYAVTQDDLEAGSISNVARVNATAPSGPVAAASPPVTSTALAQPKLAIRKTVDAATFAAVGDQLTYSIKVTNTGNVPLADVAVTDPPPGSGRFDLDCARLPPSLSPGDDGSCSATYVVAQADLDSGRVVNRARASAVDPRGGLSSATASATSAARANGELRLSKAVDEASYAAAGDVLHYTVITRNTGNVTLTNVVVTDRAPGEGAFTTTCRTIAKLAPGATSTCRASYTVTAADLRATTLVNTAFARAAGQADAISASATSRSETGSLPNVGASDLHHAGALGVGLTLIGLLLAAIGLRPRSTA